MLDLSPASPELNDSSGTFPVDAWRRHEKEKQLIRNTHDAPALKPFSQVELHALAFPGDGALCYQVEDEFEDFLATPQVALKFPPMHAFHRRVITDCALRYGLQAQSMGSGAERHVVVTKPTSAKAPSVTPLLQFHDALPSNQPREKYAAAVGYKKRRGHASVDTLRVDGRNVSCLNLSQCEGYKAYASAKPDTDRTDWMRLVYQTVRNKVPLATHAHIVEVRMADPKQDGQYAELQRFLGPFQVRWLGDNKQSGVGVIVYPSVPAANNCLDRFEDEDDQGQDPAAKPSLPFRLFPFAPHIFGPYIDDQAMRRMRVGDGTPGHAPLLGRSPGSAQGGSWRDNAGPSLMDRNVGSHSSGGRWTPSATPPLAPRDFHREQSGASPPGGGKWTPSATPPLAPRDHREHTGASPPSHNSQPRAMWAATPKQPSPGNGPYRSPAGPQPTTNQGKERWQGSRSAASRAPAAGRGHHDPCAAAPAKVTMEKAVMSVAQ